MTGDERRIFDAKPTISEYVKRTMVLGTDPFTGQELGVTVGFMHGEPTAAIYLGEEVDPTCMISIVQLGQIYGLFQELETKSW